MTPSCPSCGNDSPDHDCVCPGCGRLRTVDGSGATDLLESLATALGAPARRPAPSIGGTLSAASGMLVGVAVLLGIADRAAPDATVDPLLVAGVLAVAATLAAAALLPSTARSGAAALGLIGASLMAGGTASGQTSWAVQVATFFAVSTAFAVVPPWTRGHPALVGASLISGHLLLLAVAGDAGLDDLDLRGGGPTSATTTLTLLAALAYLSVAVTLDRRHLTGPATPVVAAANVAVAYATIGLLAEVAFGGALGGSGGAPAAMAMIATGAGLMYLGAVGERRFSLWHGCLVTVTGIVSAVAAVDDGGRGTGSAVAMLLLTAAGLLFAAPHAQAFIDRTTGRDRTAEAA